MRPIIELARGQLPARFADLPRPPSRVYLVGELPRGPCVAIVGTRHPSAEGLAFCRRLASDLARGGVAIVSGGAKGIDRAAHEGALAAGGVTVVVGPSSYDHPYPEEHASLYESVLDQGGAYVSLHARGVKPQSAQFFARNAILAALAHVVVVVESRAKGGARNAAKWSRKLGRPLLVVPGAPWSPTSVGCLAELRAGARMLVSSRDVLAELAAQRLHAIPSRATLLGETLPLFAEGPAGQSDDHSGATSAHLTDEDRVLALLREGPRYPDEIVARTGLPVPRVQELLLTLTLRGALATHPAGLVCLVSI